jgi:CelD/BcsL family acetyltransferase involved in cellulose biosynthesis
MTGKAGSLKFKVYKGRDGLAEFRKKWQALEQSNPDVAFYKRSAWYGCYLQALAIDEQSVFFYTVYNGGELTAVFPLRLVDRQFKKINLRVLQFPSHSHMALSACLIKNHDEACSIIKQLIQYINHHTDLKFDLLYLSNVLDHSSLGGALKANTLLRHFSDHTAQSFTIECKQTYDETVAHINSKFRRNVSRFERKAEKEGELSFEIFPGEHGLRLDEFIDIEHDSWKGKSGSAIKCHPHLIEFYKCLAKEFTYPACFFVGLLKLNGEAMAGQIGIRTGNTLNLLKIGYRDHYSKLGPGNIMLSHTIKYCVQDKDIKVLNIVTGPEWAEKWKSHVSPVYNHFIYNTTPIGMIGYGYHILKEACKVIMKWKNKVN